MKICFHHMAYNPGGYTIKQFDSVMCSKHEVIPILFLHNSRSQELIDECNQVIEKYPQTIYLDYGYNRGCGKSINEAFHICFEQHKCDVTVGISQDVWYNTPTAFDDWVEKCKPHIETKYGISNNDTKPPEKAAPFACIMHTRLWFEEVGCWDENFFPAQYEDIDMHRRCCFTKSGKAEDFWDNSYRTDEYSDSTHDSMLSRRDTTLAVQQFYITGPMNLNYYTRKWGGEPGKEKFTHPFNDNSIGYKIPYEKRHNPYGQYDRQDQGIVRV